MHGVQQVSKLPFECMVKLRHKNLNSNPSCDGTLRIICSLRLKNCWDPGKRMNFYLPKYLIY